jgi:hypothetical protein
MLVENLLIRPQGTREVSISWTSQTAEMRSFVFINSTLVVGAYRAETINRSIVLPVPNNKPYKIEVFDVIEDETIPYSLELNSEQLRKRIIIVIFLLRLRTLFTHNY